MKRNKIPSLPILLFSVLVCGLIIANPKAAFAWGSSTPKFATHQFIDEEAYKCLKEDPAFGYIEYIFPTIKQILEHEGNSLIYGGVGPGPDAEGNSGWSKHWYNPRIDKGGAPQTIEDLAKRLPAVFKENPKVSAWLLAWSAHFLADMFTPVHMNGTTKQEIMKIYKAATKSIAEKEPIYLGEDIAGPEVKPGRDWRREIEWFLKEAQRAEYIDFFDPWYWNSDTNLSSTHCQWEMRNPRHERSKSKCYYNSKWQNPQPTFVAPEEAYGNQAKLFAIACAKETNEHLLEWKNSNPQIALERAIQSVSTLWRASFSALVPEINVSLSEEDGREICEVGGGITNLSDENAKNVEVQLTAWDGENVKFRQKQNIGEIKSKEKKITPAGIWKFKVESQDPTSPSQKQKRRFELEVIGSFAKTPDLQYAVTEKEVEIKETKPQREMQLVSVNVPQKVEVNERVDAELRVQLKDIAPDEKITVNCKHWWTREDKLELETGSHVEIEHDAPVAIFTVAVQLNQVGEYLWHYKVGAPGYKPLEDSVPMQVVKQPPEATSETPLPAAEVGDWTLKEVKIYKPHYNLYDLPTYRSTSDTQQNSATYTENSWAEGDKYNSTLSFSWNTPPGVLRSGQTFQLTFKGNASGSPQEKCSYGWIKYCWAGFDVTIDGKKPAENCRDINVGMPSTKVWVPTKTETATFTVLTNATELAIYVGRGDSRVDFVYEKKSN